MNNEHTNTCVNPAIYSALETARQAREQLSGILENHGMNGSRYLCRLLTDLRDEKMAEVINNLEFAAEIDSREEWANLD